MAKANNTQQRALWVAYFILGLAFPLILLSNKARRDKQQFDTLDEAHDNTVEDSFPASDPPSSW